MPPILELQRAELEVTEAESREKEGEASKLQFLRIRYSFVGIC